jgi:S1-C subfamily serine protease
MKRIIVTFAFLIGAISVANGQFLTNNVLDRVKKIGVGQTTASMFTVEVDGRQYLVTAKHVVATLKGDGGQIQVFEGKGKSETLNVKVLRCDDPVDIAVLVPEKQITPIPPLSAVDGKIVFSQDVFFVGYPYGDDALGTLMEDTAVGFIRKATFAAQERKDNWVLFYLDGMNNRGFSGAPVVFQDMTVQGNPWKVIGVISG